MSTNSVEIHISNQDPRLVNQRPVSSIGEAISAFMIHGKTFPSKGEAVSITSLSQAVGIVDDTVSDFLDNHVTIAKDDRGQGLVFRNIGVAVFSLNQIAPVFLKHIEFVDIEVAAETTVTFKQPSIPLHIRPSKDAQETPLSFHVKGQCSSFTLHDVPDSSELSTCSISLSGIGNCTLAGKGSALELALSGFRKTTYKADFENVSLKAIDLRFVTFLKTGNFEHLFLHSSGKRVAHLTVAGPSKSSINVEDLNCDFVKLVGESESAFFENCDIHDLVLKPSAPLSFTFEGSNTTGRAIIPSIWAQTEVSLMIDLGYTDVGKLDLTEAKVIKSLTMDNSSVQALYFGEKHHRRDLEVLDLQNTSLTEAPVLPISAQSWPKPRDVKQANRNGWRNALALFARALDDKDRRDVGGTMRAMGQHYRLLNTPWSDFQTKIPLSVYHLISGFGQSLLRPTVTLFALMGLAFCFHVLIECGTEPSVDPEKNEHLGRLVLQGVFPALSRPSLSDVHVAHFIVFALHSLGTTLCLFLFGLAIRARSMMR